MHVLKDVVVLCLVIRFRPTSRIVRRLYRERTMEKLRTNKKVPTSPSNELKQVSARETRSNQF